MDRRGFMASLACGAAIALTGCTEATRRLAEPVPPDLADHVLPEVGRTQATNLAAPILATPTPAASQYASLAASGDDRAAAVVDRLPTLASSATERRLALTIDDGVSTAVLSAYVDFLQAAQLRATFFVTAAYQSWTVVRHALAPMVESGQVQLANHTWDHPDITQLSATQIRDQLNRTEQFLWNTYGVRGAPYFRPPYGMHNKNTDTVTESLGFKKIVLWWGSLGDASILTGQQILDLAREWFLPGRIVIGHANHPGVTTVYPQLLELIRDRTLQTVTLRDAFET